MLLVDGVPAWPVYDNTDGYGQEYVFDANVTSYVEYDTYRAEAIQYMIDNSASLFQRWAGEIMADNSTFSRWSLQRGIAVG